MSYDLAVWEGPAPAGDEAALATYKRLLGMWQDAGSQAAFQAKLRGERTAYDPTPAIVDYVAGLLERWPDLDDCEDEEESPWADGPIINNATGPLFYFAMVYSRADEAVAFAADLAKRHGLNCFDPQADRLLTPPMPSVSQPDGSASARVEVSRGSRRTWRRKGRRSPPGE